MVETARVQPQAPQSSPPRLINGQVIYKPGPWGLRRPVRTATVNVKTNAGNPNPHAAPHILLGFVDTSPKGEFSIWVPRARGTHYLEIVEFHTDETVLLPVDFNSTFPSYVFPFAPQLPDLARVNGQGFVFIQDLAGTLCRIIQAPTYPIPLTLLRESNNGEPDDRYEYTRAQEMFRIVDSGLPPDFPEQLVKELNFVPGLSTIARTTEDALVASLRRISTLDIRELERGQLPKDLLNAIAAALQVTLPLNPVEDLLPDVAAACVFLFVAGLMARDRAKATAVFSSVGTLKPLRLFRTIHVFVQR